MAQKLTTDHSVLRLSPNRESDIVNKAERIAKLTSLADADVRARTISVRRHIDSEIGYAGVGAPLLSLALIPSFSPASLWEIRDSAGKLVAYRSRGFESGSPYVIGHSLIVVAHEQLFPIVKLLQGATPPISMYPPEFVSTDGEIYVATFHGGFKTSIRLQWCGAAAPAEWRETIRILLDLRDLLETCPDAV